MHNTVFTVSDEPLNPQDVVMYSEDIYDSISSADSVVEEEEMTEPYIGKVIKDGEYLKWKITKKDTNQFFKSKYETFKKAIANLSFEEYLNPNFANTVSSNVDPKLDDYVVYDGWGCMSLDDFLRQTKEGEFYLGKTFDYHW